MSSGQTDFIGVERGSGVIGSTIENGYIHHGLTQLVSIRNINEVYYEEVHPPPIFRYLLYGIVGLLAYLTTVEMGSMPRVLAALGIGVVFIMMSIFGTLRVVITDKDLTVGFNFIKHHVALDNIDYVETRNFPWYYGGFGVRLGLDWSTGFVQNYGRGVWVVPKRGRKLYFSTNSPDEVVDKINEMIIQVG